MPLGDRHGEELAPSRQAVEDGAVSKERRIFMVCGRVRATTVAPRSAAAVEAASWWSEAAGVHGGDPEHVPVDRSVGQQREGGHQIDLLVAEAVQATRGR